MIHTRSRRTPCTRLMSRVGELISRCKVGIGREEISQAKATVMDPSSIHKSIFSRFGVC